MGYNTEFKGVLTFNSDIKVGALRKLTTYLGEDCREHPEWDRPDLTYINLEITEEYVGLQWNGAEKTYDLVDKVNLVIREMQKKFPEFALEGELVAQGENMNDRWILKMENNVAVKKSIVITGEIITCPHCGEKFVLEN